MKPGTQLASSAVVGPRDTDSLADRARAHAENTGVQYSYTLRLASNRWTLACNSAAYARVLEAAFGANLSRIRSPASGGAGDRPDRGFHIHCIDLQGQGGGLQPPASKPLPGSADPARRIWISGQIRVGHQLADDVVSVVDLCRRWAYVQVPDAARLPYYERAAPLRGLLHWLVAARGDSLVHAAAVGTEAGAALLIGRGGTGKTSTAVAGLAAGMHFGGDDYVAVTGGAEPRALGLYQSVKADRGDRELYPELDVVCGNPEGAVHEKAVLFLQRPPPGFREGMPLRALLLPRITPGPMRVEPCTPAAALQALAPSTLLQAAGYREHLFRHCALLARQLPAFTLHTGSRGPHFGADLRRHLLPILERGADRR